MVLCGLERVDELKTSKINVCFTDSLICFEVFELIFARKSSRQELDLQHAFLMKKK